MGPESFGVIFGMASAITWGAGDFCGGLATKRSKIIGVLFVSQLIGAPLLVIPLLIWHDPFPGIIDLIWGAAGGACGVVGIAAFYIGLANGRMGVVAPMAAVVSAGLPVLVGAIIEGLPPAIKYVGFGLGLISIWLVSRSSNTNTVRLKELGLPLLAGLSFGGYFIFLDQAADTAVFWPLIAARATSLSMILITGMVMRERLFPAKEKIPLIVLTGVLDTGGNLFYMLAAKAGRLDIAAVLAALYPAATVLLARLILKELISQWQLIGILAALGAVMLIAV